MKLDCWLGMCDPDLLGPSAFCNAIRLAKLLDRLTKHNIRQRLLPLQCCPWLQLVSVPRGKLRPMQRKESSKGSHEDDEREAGEMGA